MDIAKTGAIASIVSAVILAMSFGGGLIAYFGGFSDKDADLSTQIAVINTNISYMKDGIKELRKDVETLKTISKRVDKKVDMKNMWASGKPMNTVDFVPIYTLGAMKEVNLDYKLFLQAATKAEKSEGIQVMLVCGGNVDGCKKAFPKPWGPNTLPWTPDKK